MIELERTFLVRALPENIGQIPSKKIVDFYVINGKEHLNLRIRKSADSHEVTRKTPVKSGDASIQKETTIEISEIEFNSLISAKTKKIEKTRYFFKCFAKTAELDVFEGPLRGLVTVDFEFTNECEKNCFTMPDFCLADITQEDFIAGGALAGKSFEDIETDLQKFGYSPLCVF